MKHVAAALLLALGKKEISKHTNINLKMKRG
jgi:hypothetical protein